MKIETKGPINYQMECGLLELSLLLKVLRKMSSAPRTSLGILNDSLTLATIYVIIKMEGNEGAI
ncbi:MAG: hypothetical protein E7602_03960 [Ruminococcaceae bacterium]|nr:hypothetical protein [Oscillospiraceae bacterium]